MQVLYPRCAGLDVHKKTVVACVRVLGPDGPPQEERRTFGTMTEDLLRLSDWLQGHAVTHVALESTGVYWQPVYNVLESSFTLLLVNAQHVKHVPGRKTDVLDCAWLAQLLQHGLLRASFVPARPQRELRELTRYRTALVQERSAEVNRVAKTLEGANIKLGSVASDLQGASAQAMLAGLVAGETDAAALADLAKGRLRAKLPQLEQALDGRVGDHARFLVARQLAHLEYLGTLIAEVSAEVADRLRPFEAELERLDAIPGVGRDTAEVLLAELGTDMERFPTAKHCASWAGMCPGNHESAGKRHSGKTRKGDRWLRRSLIEAARAASHTKDTYLAAQYHRLVVRRGKKKAAVAVGHSILVIAYHLLQDGTEYEDLGGAYFDERDRQAVIRHAVSRLQRLGLKVTVEPLAATA